MLESIMQTILTASFTAGIAAIAVMLLRIPMQKLPKKWSYMLWAVVFFRCLCPLSAESAVSIFNVFASEHSTSVQVTEAVYDVQTNLVTEYHYGNVQVSSDDPIYKDYSGNAAFNRTTADAVPGTASEEKPIDRDTVIFAIWVTGVMVMIWYAVISYTMLMQKVSAAVKMPDGVYETDMISTAFTAGCFVPRIYLPYGLSENERRLIIAHEKVHIRRFDFILKPLAFAGLALHWFNPFIWAAFALMARDMELSCDEAVLESLGPEEKEDYSEALLKVSMKKSGLAAAPAFAETGVKYRVKNVLEYKKPGIAGTVLAALIVVSSCAVLGTNAVESYSASGAASVSEDTAIISQVYDSGSLMQGQTAVSPASEASEQWTYAGITQRLEAEEAEAENFSYAVYASDTDYPVKTYDVLISYPDGIIEEFTIAENQLFAFSDLSSTEFKVAVAEASDTEIQDTIFEYSSEDESTAEYPVYITVTDAIDSVREYVVMHESGEYTMSILYEPYGMYYDYQKNCYIYNGDPVRFFYDPIEGASFTNYYTGTIDLEAVYEDGVLAGVTECSDEAYALHDEKQELFSSVLPDTSIVVLPDTPIVMVK
ncbi:MAG: hypothetical protein J1F11_04345 [Oscillospiraceae bacterium]|nr:hypothetical protein [Oscillospiraceae bacterium]